MLSQSTPDVETQAARRQYYERIAAQHMTPLWEVLGALVPPSPRPDAVPVARAAPVIDSFPNIPEPTPRNIPMKYAVAAPAVHT